MSELGSAICVLVDNCLTHQAVCGFVRFSNTVQLVPITWNKHKKNVLNLWVGPNIFIHVTMITLMPLGIKLVLLAWNITYAFF